MREYGERLIKSARAKRDAMDRAGALLTDAQAVEVMNLYPALHGGGARITAGTRIRWEGQLKRAAVDLWDRPEHWPSAAPALWEDIRYDGDLREIPEVFTAGLAFAKGERGLFRGAAYESLLDGNVWTPAEYPAGWKALDTGA